MIIRNITTASEIEQCVDMYLSYDDPDFMPGNKGTSVQNLRNAVRSNKFVKGLFDNNVLIAWIYCDIVNIQHLNLPNFQQLYFCSKTTPIKTYKAIQLLHKEMIHYAENLNVGYCVSTGSHLDKKNTFVRCLEREGWKVRHYIAVWEMPRKKGPPRPQVWRRGNV